MKQQNNDLTQGAILPILIRFSLPVLLALLLQAMYGAVDLLVVGQFASSADVSAVATGSNVMMTLTNPLSSFAMGITVLLGYAIGQKKPEEAGRIIGAGIVLFAILSIVFALILTIFTSPLASMMQTPQEAYDKTVSYVRICGAGVIAIIFYNLLGSVFRGIGDSRTPLITVMIACVINIFADLFLVAVCGLGAAGAAIATVAAQCISVLLSLALISKRELPFTFRKEMIRFDGGLSLKITKLGLPLAISSFLVGVSFMIIQAIVNSLGLIPSAGIGVAEKVCNFVMLVPSAFMQAIAAFTAQNVGAGKEERAEKALRDGILLSLAAGAVMFYLAFFHGDLLCGIFSREPEVILAGADYLKSYAIDCLLTAVFFVFVGYFNGLGLTRFVMVQGMVGAFGVRVPVSFFMSRIRPVSLFKIGLATPASSLVQIILCLGCMFYTKKKQGVRKTGKAESDSYAE
ncbi:MAG: MATE family efflux transporter [Blautia sp.]|nr:MATE family efflux transporter [Blautia sp.]